MRYLVSTDGSEESDAAVSYAAEQAAAFDADLEIVHVITPETEIVDGEIILEGQEDAHTSGQHTLDQAVNLAQDAVPDHDLEIETQLLSGRPTDAIVDRALAADVDAIYVGHRGLSQSKEAVVGSVAKSIVSKADVPVTVVR